MEHMTIYAEQTCFPAQRCSLVLRTTPSMPYYLNEQLKNATSTSTSGGLGSSVFQEFPEWDVDMVMTSTTTACGE